MKKIMGALTISTDPSFVCFYRITKGTNIVGNAVWQHSLMAWVFEPVPNVVFLEKTLREVAKLLAKLKPLESMSYALAAAPEEKQP